MSKMPDDIDAYIDNIRQEYEGLIKLNKCEDEKTIRNISAILFKSVAILADKDRAAAEEILNEFNYLMKTITDSSNDEISEIEKEIAVTEADIFVKKGGKLS